MGRHHHAEGGQEGVSTRTGRQCRTERDRLKITEALERLDAVPEGFNRALTLSFEIRLAAETGKLDLQTLVASRGEIEAAVSSGNACVKGIEAALKTLDRLPAFPRRDRPPRGF